MLTVDQIIHTLNLQPLPGEGGLYAETYRSAETVPAPALPARYPQAKKPFGTAILYLLTGHPDSFSAFHRLPTDEIWHFYLGDPLELFMLGPEGSVTRLILGQDLLAGQRVQAVVPAGVWQAARLVPGDRMLPGGRFALVGTTMAPGFTPSDFEPGRRAHLFSQYPAARDAIQSLTREEAA
jgi:predicted cupin superfamily sugar epimerase